MDERDTITAGSEASIRAYNEKWRDAPQGPARKITFSTDRSLRHGWVHLMDVEPSMPLHLVSNIHDAYAAFEAAGHPVHFVWSPSNPDIVAAEIQRGKEMDALDARLNAELDAGRMPGEVSP